MAPRYLNAPPVCRFSHLKKTRRPQRASKASLRITGVRTMYGPMRAAAATTSANAGKLTPMVQGSQPGKFGSEEMFAVVRELADGFLDVRQCLVLTLLRESGDD